MNIPQGAVFLASGAESGPTFLGEDLVAWRTAIVAAAVAAVIYELAMAATRKITLRLPFLILYLARITLTRAQWRRLHGEWVAELHYILRDDSAPWISRLTNGLRYATPLALGGARNAAKTVGKRILRRCAIKLQLSAAEWGILSGGVIIIAVMSSPLSQLEKSMILFSPAFLTAVGFMAAHVLRTHLPRKARHQRQSQSGSSGP